MDDGLIIEIWDTFKEYIPEKNRGTAASQYVDYLLGKDITAADLESYLGYDPHLDDAITEVVDSEDYDDADDEEYDQAEDEDY